MICICNDLYAPALRSLRQVARYFFIPYQFYAVNWSGNGCPDFLFWNKAVFLDLSALRILWLDFNEIRFMFFEVTDLLFGFTYVMHVIINFLILNRVHIFVQPSASRVVSRYVKMNYDLKNNWHLYASQMTSMEIHWK